MKRGLPVLLVLGVLAAMTLPSLGVGGQSAGARTACGNGYVPGVIGGENKCLHAGQFCSAQRERDYERYGFSCVGGHLRSGGSAPAGKPHAAAGPPALGRTVLISRRTRRARCRVGLLPDRRCSPGAYSSGLTRAVICADSFRTSSIRHVTDSTKHEVEREYGMEAKPYGRTLEIDHIISLELGGSNDIANLFPEPAPGYKAKDRLENRLHDMVCAGSMSLSNARKRIAANWVALYRAVFGTLPAT